MRNDDCLPGEAPAIISPEVFAASLASDEIDQRIAGDPWIIRNRLTFAAYAARCRQAGTEPTMRQWMDHLRLTDEEMQRLNDLIEAKREAHCLELGDRFIIAEYGNKARVGWFNDRDELVTMSPAEFAAGRQHMMIEVGRDKAGKPIMRPLVTYWLRHTLSPRFERVEFRPGVAQSDMPEGVLNLWRGWPMGLVAGWDARRLTPTGSEPVTDWELDGDEMPPGHCDLFLDHMLHAMCGGDEELRHYVLGWMADALWNPGPCETAIVLRGPEGSGKSLWAQHFMELFGPHALTLDDPQQVVGNFNKHLMNKAVVFADEAFFAGHPGHAAKLKTLVTRPDLFVEPKGVDGFTAPKMFRLIMASNEDHVIRAGREDRRYLVLNVDAGARNQDKGYFGALVDEWRGGGRRALFRWLTGAWWGRAVGGDRFRAWPRPVTAGLQEQKDMSLPAAQMVVHNMLREGEVPCPHDADARRDMVFVPTDLLIRAGGLRQTERKALGAALAVIADNEARPDRIYIGAGNDRRQHRGKWLPPLAECRARWEAHLGRPVAWPGDVTGWALEPSRYADDDDTPF